MEIGEDRGWHRQSSRYGDAAEGRGRGHSLPSAGSVSWSHPTSGTSCEVHRPMLHAGPANTDFFLNIVFLSFIWIILHGFKKFEFCDPFGHAIAEMGLSATP